MALDSKDIPITREDAQQWIYEYDQTHRDDSKLRAFLESKITALKLPDEMVDTSHRDDISANSSHVVDLLMADLSSYARHTKPPA